MSQMLKASGAMAAATLTSRVLGLGREMVYAAFMGNTWVASAFTLAFQVPNLFRRLLGEGALTAAFIPIFKQQQVRNDENEMWRTANAVISGLLVAAGGITLLAIVGISLALGYGEFKPETVLMLRLLRWMFPYMLLACLAALLIGMANARGHFFVPALGSVLLNVVMIASVLLMMYLPQFKDLKLEESIFGLAIGVVVAGIAQAGFQMPGLCREGYRFAWVAPWGEPTVREVVVKMIPGSIGVAAFQINVLATQSFSFWFDPTIVSTFNYSVRLMELPQGLFGISLATFLLPTLSGLAAEKKFPEFRATLKQGFNYLAFANLIAAAIALALAVPIVRLLFERGKFDAEATHRVAVALACLAPGLLLFSMNNILARAFYALKDIKTPMKISLVCLALNLGFALWLVRAYREAGLAVANTVSAGFNTALLLVALRKKMARLDLAGLPQNIFTLLGAAAAAGAVAFGLYHFWDAKLGHATWATKLGSVFVPGALAGALYWFLAFWARVPTATEMAGLVARKWQR